MPKPYLRTRPQRPVCPFPSAAGPPLSSRFRLHRPVVARAVACGSRRTAVDTGVSFTQGRGRWNMTEPVPLTANERKALACFAVGVTSEGSVAGDDFEIGGRNALLLRNG